MSYFVLIVEDEETQQYLINKVLSKKFNYSTHIVSNGVEALAYLGSHISNLPDLVLLDMVMPRMDGLETLKAIKKQLPDMPVIMLTGEKAIDNAVLAMKLGASDFINKPFEPYHLNIAIRNAIKLSNVSKELSHLKGQQRNVTHFSDLIGAGSGLQHITHIGQKAAASTIPVLVTGETGTGKELFAQAIHGESGRSGKPFITVNCGAIPEGLVESTLFGHKKGAFTGAIDNNPGKFKEADGGTLFLDEIGELPLDAQVKLLRVLQEKEVEAVGANTGFPIDVRVISATNRNLAQEVANGHFREDLFFRLNVLPIRIPALAERRQDIPLLLEYFTKRTCNVENIPLKNYSQEAREMLNQYHWPGNVRELENLVYRLIILGDGDVIHKGDVLPFIGDSSNNSQEGSLPPSPFTGGTSFLDSKGSIKPILEIEREAIAFALMHFSSNITQAAQALGIAKSTFYKRLKKFGLAREV